MVVEQEAPLPIASSPVGLLLDSLEVHWHDTKSKVLWIEPPQYWWILEGCGLFASDALPTTGAASTSPSPPPLAHVGWLPLLDGCHR